MQADNVLDCLLSEKRGLVNIFACLLSPLGHCHPDVVLVRRNLAHVLKRIPFGWDVGRVNAATISLEQLNVVFLIKSSTHLVAAAVLIVTPPCRAAPAMLGANAWTPAMKLHPMFDVIHSTSCRLPVPPPLYCSTACCGSCPRIALRCSSYHSRNSGSWHSAGSSDPRLRMLVPLFPVLRQVTNPVQVATWLSGPEIPPRQCGQAEIFAVCVGDMPRPVSQGIQ